MVPVEPALMHEIHTVDTSSNNQANHVVTFPAAPAESNVDSVSITPDKHHSKVSMTEFNAQNVQSEADHPSDSTSSAFDLYPGSPTQTRLQEMRHAVQSSLNASPRNARIEEMREDLVQNLNKQVLYKLWPKFRKCYPW